MWDYRKVVEIVGGDQSTVNEQERMAQLQYEAGMYKALYENAKEQAFSVTRELLAAISGIHGSYGYTHRQKSRVSHNDANMAAELDSVAGAAIQRAEDWLEAMMEATDVR